MAWQQNQQRLPRIQTDAESSSSAAPPPAETNTSRQQMGPPAPLPSLNFRQLAPLRSPNLPSSTHSSSYFSQQRHRSTSESIANDALRTLRHGQPPLPNLPEPPSNILLSSAKRGETLPPLAAFGHHSSSSAAGRSSKAPTSASPYYHPYQQQTSSTYSQSNPISNFYRSPNSLQSPTSPGQAGPISSFSTSQDPRYYSPPSSSKTFDRSIDRSREGSSSTMDKDDPNSPRRLAKSHVPSACLNCKRAHLACDVSRPCRRCINLGKTDTCVDVQHKKRGRPRLRDREAAAAAAAAAAASGPGRNIALIDQRAPSGMPGQNVRGSISSNSTTSTMRQSPRSEPTTYFSGELNVLSSPTRASTIPSMAQRGRSISSSASLWSQTTPSGGIPASTPGDYTDASSSPTVSLILSTGLQCARCSVESHALLGYSPSDLIERSLFELVHPSETQRLEQLWMSLIEPVGVRSQVVPADAETVMTLSPAILMAPAPGTVYMQETMRLRQRSGIYDFYSIRLHLGGGFGADLYQTSTLDRAYIVASLLKLGNDATHPDPNLLREARWYHGNDPRHFTTPQLSSTAAAERTSGNAMIDTSEAGGYGAIGAAVDSDSPDKSYHTAASSIPNRYDWQRLDKNSRPTQAPLTQPLPPPPYSKSAYHNNNKHSSTITAPIYNNDTRKDHRLSSSSSYISSSKRKSVDQHSTTSSFSYSSNGGERGSILC